jgi:hypothetical protein
VHIQGKRQLSSSSASSSSYISNPVVCLT